MKKSLLGLIVGMSLISLGVAQTVFFPDVRPDEWFFEYVSEIKDWGIIDGQGDGTFAPAQNINRAEFSKMLVLYDDRVDEKITNQINQIEIPVIQETITQEPIAQVPASIMQLERYELEPALCPTDWTEADYQRIDRSSGSFVNLRTCITNQVCSVVHLPRYDNPDTAECPTGWTEAQNIQTWREPGNRYYARTCYICAQSAKSDETQ